jgi:hypothetical protein
MSHLLFRDVFLGVEVCERKIPVATDVTPCGRFAHIWSVLPDCVKKIVFLTTVKT